MQRDNVCELVGGVCVCVGVGRGACTCACACGVGVYVRVVGTSWARGRAQVCVCVWSYVVTVTYFPPFSNSRTVQISTHAGISGLIGAGKTTLATALAKELDLPVYYEPVS